MDQDAPSVALKSRVDGLFPTRKTVHWRRVLRGYTPAERWVVTLSNGRTIFVKAGNDVQSLGMAESIAHGLRKEYRIYSRLRGFLPEMLGWLDTPEITILILEDLSSGFWPPPWECQHVEAVLQTLSEVHAQHIPGEMGMAAGLDPQSWLKVLAEPGPFLSLGLCSARWLEDSASSLSSAARKATLRGAELCHFDVRSDNICVVDGRAKLIDWNWCGLGNGRIDTAFWLPSLESEGGPSPEAILPNEPECAALVSGFFAGRAGLPAIPALPHVRDVQLSQLKSALPWAARALGLPAPGGTNV